jgi:Phosphotransferase enzyme family
VEFDEESHDFVLVLEDLAPAQPGNQLTGCTVEQARLAVVEAARLHGPRWDDPTLHDIDWLQRRTARADAELLATACGHFLPKFLETYGKYFSTDQQRLVESFVPKVAGWIEGRKGPLTLGHGDYRLDNLMFGTPEGGPPVAAVDWQTPNHGQAATDVSYFMGAGLMPNVRRSVENGIIDEYLGVLRSYDVDYSRDAFWRDYVHDTFAGLVMAIVASQVVTPTERGEAMFAAMATRAAQHALDLDSFDTL